MENHSLARFTSEYRAVLQDLLQQTNSEAHKRVDETGLKSAYELGRKCMEEGLGMVELFQIHTDAVMNLMDDGIQQSEGQRMFRLASEFFTETLSPFEMTHRGFQEAIDELRKQRSELVQINQTLAEKDELFRLITENISDMIAILDVDGRRLYNSPSYRLLKEDIESLRGTDSFADVHINDRERIRRVFAETVQTGAGHREEYKLVTREGKVRFIESQGNVIRNSAGVVEKVVVVSRDITSRKESEEALRILARRVSEVQEEERGRIARELHDDVCQRLTALKMQLEIVESDYGHRNSELVKKLRTFRNTMKEVVDEIRRISANLRPLMLDELGLEPALRRLSEQCARVNSVKVRFDSQDFHRRHMEDEVEIAVYRIAQEALANVLKHSKARNVLISLASDKQEVSLTVADDGKGFHTDRQHDSADHDGFGLISMRERAQLVGGSLTVSSEPRKGTEINAQIPYRAESKKKNKNRAR